MLLYFKGNNNEKMAQGAMEVYVDDTLMNKIGESKNLTENFPKNYESKRNEFPPFKFAGINIKKRNSIIHRARIVF